MLKPLSEYVALSGLVVLLTSVFGLLTFRVVARHQAEKQRRIASPTGIDVMERVRLGDLDQWIRIRGQDSHLPLLLFLDGGPGVPEMPFAPANAELERHFLVVHWDQRGAGKSFDPAIPPASMNVAQLVSDAEELVNLLRHRFSQDQIFLAAHSTGSVLGVFLVQRDPQLFRAYIGISQVANLQMTETFLYNFATSAAVKVGDRK
ncbi:MAG: alpha/beta hydrolase, partial [Verrucomicrobiota bacterium]|nr:alpha/beta hydrolase [Verrucomicrobiota bacterium]